MRVKWDFQLLFASPFMLMRLGEGGRPPGIPDGDLGSGDPMPGLLVIIQGTEHGKISGIWQPKKHRCVKLVKQIAPCMSCLAQ